MTVSNIECHILAKSAGEFLWRGLAWPLKVRT